VNPAKATLARAALGIGLVGAAIGLFVGLGQWMNALGFMRQAEPIPYALGAVAMLLAIVSLIVERRYRLGAWALLSGAAAALIVPAFLYAVLVLVAVVIVAALTSS
jgi:hypothetical protein